MSAPHPEAAPAAPLRSAVAAMAGYAPMAGELADLYRDIHRHPELSMAEHRTAAIAAGHLERAGFRVSAGVGGTGVVGVLANGLGPTIALRADMDALPLAEATGLPYASRVEAPAPDGVTVPVMHACGHDMHVAWLVGAARLLAAARDRWSGTLVALFQPGEETAQGARSMLDGGLAELIPRPDLILAQHVLPEPAGWIGHRPGVALAAGDSFEVHLFGRGGHGSWPEATVDPVIMAAATALRLQTIVSREVSAHDAVNLTIGAIQAGTKDNIIPDRALMRLKVRTFDDAVRARVLAALERIVRAEALASDAPRPPEIIATEHYPLTVNDPAATGRLEAAMVAHFGAAAVHRMDDPLPASEDFGLFGRELGAPAVFWFVGGIDPELHRRAVAEGRLRELVPTNHSPHFAPVIEPTLRTGVAAMVVAALAELGPPSGG